MKTSLVIEDSLFKAAQKEAQKTGATLSETISYWARLGREMLVKNKKNKSKRSFKPVNLGGSALVDINSRRDYLDLLES